MATNPLRGAPEERPRDRSGITAPHDDEIRTDVPRPFEDLPRGITNADTRRDCRNRLTADASLSLQPAAGSVLQLVKRAPGFRSSPLDLGQHEYRTWGMSENRVSDASDHSPPEPSRATAHDDEIAVPSLRVPDDLRSRITKHHLPGYVGS